MKLRTYWLDCREHTDNIGLKNNYDKSKCGVCLSDKSRFLKEKHNKKSGQ